MIKKGWNFPGNNFTAEMGLDTADMETFKRNPVAALAREICQNSIDARLGDKPVEIDFKLFTVKREEIPGISELIDEIQKCYFYWGKKGNSKIRNRLEDMLKEVTKNEITCLRISDFNTKGLTGVSKKFLEPGKENNFYLLTKGSGLSEKSGTTGGSKGIGKFATFVNSKFHTVFYSTVTKDNEVGYLGISKLCSAPKDRDNFESERTLGIGYYGLGEENYPIMEFFSLDKKFKRINNQYGTDIYILGFKTEVNWEKNIISQVLDSFMCAIQFETLIVNVNNIAINKESLNKIINRKGFLNSLPKKTQRSILSQYHLLNDNNVKKEVINMGEYGNVDFYFKEFSRDLFDYALNTCVMIRYPYMKIKLLNRLTYIPTSMMCIIGDNKLNSMLRDLENPQHTDWEFGRIEDERTRIETEKVYKELIRKIEQLVKGFLGSSDNDSSDVEGASDYLPDSEEFADMIGKPVVVRDTVTVSTSIVNRIIEKKGKVKSGLSIDEDDGEHVVDGDEIVPVPTGVNQGEGGDMRGPNEGKGSNEGGKKIGKYFELTGIKYRWIVIDKTKGLYAVIFQL